MLRPGGCFNAAISKNQRIHLGERFYGGLGATRHLHVIHENDRVTIHSTPQLY